MEGGGGGNLCFFWLRGNKEYVGEDLVIRMVYFFTWWGKISCLG